MTGHHGEVKSVAFGTSPDGRLLLATCCVDVTVQVWDPLTGTPATAPLTGHTGWVESVAFGTSPDGRLLLASGSTDRTIRIWDPITGSPAAKSLIGHKGSVFSGSVRGYQEPPHRRRSRPRPSRQSARPYVYASPTLGVSTTSSR
jgi:WD40 repeat protein